MSDKPMPTTKGEEKLALYHADRTIRAACEASEWRAWLKIALMALEGPLDHQAVIAAHIRRETGLEP